jgi:hypothetical protein
MVGKNGSENWEREALRRNLLATMLCSANASRSKGSHGRWARFWQGLFKNHG